MDNDLVIIDMAPEQPEVALDNGLLNDDDPLSVYIKRNQKARIEDAKINKTVHTELFQRMSALEILTSSDIKVCHGSNEEQCCVIN